MNLNLSLFIALLFATVGCDAQTYSSATSDKEIYQFLNWLTQTQPKYSEEPALIRKQIYNGISDWDTANFVLRDTVSRYGPFNPYLFAKGKGPDTIFSAEDRTFLMTQFSSKKDTVWHKPFANSTLLKNAKQLKPNRYFYSVPLFSIDRNYVIVRKTYYCGPLCAYGGYYVYRRITSKKWIAVLSIYTWMS